MAVPRVPSNFSYNPGNPFDFEDGDVTITVQQGITGKVSSTCMRQASLVWINLLLPFNTPNPASATHLDLTTSAPHALLLLLRIAHNQHRYIPAQISDQTLFDLSVLCDKYDCIELVSPWLSNWLEIKPLPSREDRRLFVYWVFGCERGFRELAVGVARRVEVDGEGRGVMNAFWTEDAMTPPGLMESIIRTRSLTIHRVLEIVNLHLETFRQNINTSNTTIACTLHSDCNSFLVSSLLKGVITQSLELPETADKLQCSINHLLKCLLGHGSAYKEGGCMNYQLLKEELETAVESMESPVLKSHVRHMEVQRERLRARWGERRVKSPPPRRVLELRGLE